MAGNGIPHGQRSTEMMPTPLSGRVAVAAGADGAQLLLCFRRLHWQSCLRWSHACRTVAPSTRGPSLRPARHRRRLATDARYTRKPCGAEVEPVVIQRARLSLGWPHRAPCTSRLTRCYCCRGPSSCSLRWSARACDTPAAERQSVSPPRLPDRDANMFVANQE